jgi:predicted ATPase
MQLDELHLTGYKSFRELALRLSPLNVLIGANGVGKSNFISLFRLLNQVVEQNFQVFVPTHGGAETFLHYGRKATPEITLQLVFGKNGYRVKWLPTVDDRLIFAEEACAFFKGAYVNEYWETIGAGHQESRLKDAAQQTTFNVPQYVLKNLDSWKVYHFHDTSETASVKLPGQINDNFVLRPDARNLAAYLYRLQQTHYAHYEAIRDTVRMVAPFFDDFLLRPMPEDEKRIRLEWRERGSDTPFLAHYLSDGTLRFICLATLLLQPVHHLPSTIVVDEPELGLHPYAINILASLLRSTATQTQIIVATQSVTLVNQFEPQNLLIVERRGQESTIARPEPEQLESWLEDYTLGELWEKNVLGGRPLR